MVLGPRYEGTDTELLPESISDHGSRELRQPKGPGGRGREQDRYKGSQEIDGSWVDGLLVGRLLFIQYVYVSVYKSRPDVWSPLNPEIWLFK